MGDDGLTKEEVAKRDQRKGRFHKEFAPSAQQRHGATSFSKASAGGKK